MSQPRRFDHDECRRLYATGQWTKTALARKYGVSPGRIYQILDPAVKQRVDARAAEWARRHYWQPCSTCGRRVWRRGSAPATGLCRRCLGESRRTAPHGSETRYTWGCRCEECRVAANRARALRRRHPNVASHGRNSSYSNGCRCDECRAAHTAYVRERRQRAAA